MPFPATVYKVLIASPSDLADERAAVVDEIQVWNAAHGQELGVVLIPVRWETDVAPRLDGRPQEIVNDEIVRPSDLLVGMFWTRIGSPTGVAESGTLEEIGEFRASGKPVMLYFSTRDMPQQGHDPEQYARLRRFKDEIRAHGIIDEFSNPSDLRHKIGRHLTRAIRRLEEARRDGVPPETDDHARAASLAAAASRRAMIAEATAQSPLNGHFLRESATQKACLVLVNQGTISGAPDRVKVEFTVRNEGDAPAREVSVSVLNDEGRPYSGGGAVDTLQPEGSRVFVLSVARPADDDGPSERRFEIRARWRDRHGWDNAVFGLVVRRTAGRWQREIDRTRTQVSRPCSYVQPG